MAETKVAQNKNTTISTVSNWHLKLSSTFDGGGFLPTTISI